MRGRGPLFLCLAVSILIHAVWIWCSSPPAKHRPISAPVEIGWRQIPREAVADAVAPAAAKTFSEKPASSLAVPPRQSSSPASTKPTEAEPAPVATAAQATKPAAPTLLPQKEHARSSGEEVSQASNSASDGSAPTSAPGPAAAPLAGGSLVEAIPLEGDNPPPVYPRLARQRGWEGLVSLQVRVSALGEVEEVWVESSSGHAVLDQAALKAVGKWRFRPAREGLQAVSGVARVPIEFRLRGG